MKLQKKNLKSRKTITRMPKKSCVLIFLLGFPIPFTIEPCSVPVSTRTLLIVLVLGYNVGILFLYIKLYDYFDMLNYLLISCILYHFTHADRYRQAI